MTTASTRNHSMDLEAEGNSALRAAPQSRQVSAASGHTVADNRQQTTSTELYFSGGVQARRNTTVRGGTDLKRRNTNISASDEVTEVPKRQKSAEVIHIS